MFSHGKTLLFAATIQTKASYGVFPLLLALMVSISVVMKLNAAFTAPFEGFCALMHLAIFIISFIVAFFSSKKSVTPSSTVIKFYTSCHTKHKQMPCMTSLQDGVNLNG